MSWIRPLLSYALTLAVITALVLIVPRFLRLQVPAGGADIARLEPGTGLNADCGFPFARLAAGDPIAFRTGGAADGDLGVGWVAAVAGDEVAVTGGRVQVGGRPAANGAAVTLADRAPVVVPAGCVFVLSDHHRSDSLALGFIPAAAYRAKLTALP